METEEIEIDTIETGAEESSTLEAARKEAEQIKKLQTLFKGNLFAVIYEMKLGRFGTAMGKKIHTLLKKYV